MPRNPEKDHLHLDLLIARGAYPWLKQRVRKNFWYKALIILALHASLALGFFLNFEVEGTKGKLAFGLAVGAFLLIWAMLVSGFRRLARRSRDYKTEMLRVVNLRLDEIGNSLKADGLAPDVRVRLSAQRLVAELTQKKLVAELYGEKPPTTRGTNSELPPPVHEDDAHEIDHMGDTRFILERGGMPGANNR